MRNLSYAPGEIMPQMQGLVRAAPHSEMLAEVRKGLAQPQKELPPKYFYDHAGSLLFEQITRLPEYYLTRVERDLLQQCTPWFVTSTGCRTLVELGAGSASKTRILLDGMRRAATHCSYLPIDLSGDFLSDTSRALRAAYPDLQIMPVVADISKDFRLPRHEGPVLFALLGSTIGNFDDAEARQLLHRIRGLMEPRDCFLLGADLRKDRAELEAAYNDSEGVTAKFNLNILEVLNRELGADFDLTAFTHQAFYDEELHRIEMHLVSSQEQVVAIPGIGWIALRQGETIRTEISCKYDRPSIERLLSEAGLELVEWHVDEHRRFGLALARGAED